MSSQPFSNDWRANRKNNQMKMVLLTCGVLFAVPLFFIFIAIVTAVFSKDSVEHKGREVAPVQERLTMTSKPAADGLDLEALLAAFKEAPNAEAFEKVLNDQASGLNNLDLNADGKVDFIKVTEYGNQKDVFGFALSTEPEAGNEQELARIEVFKNANKADVQVVGNEQIYGKNYGYSTAFDVAQIAMLAYLISNTYRPYRSSYGFGYYPGYYRPYRYIDHDRYRSRSSGYKSNLGSVSRMSQPRNVPQGVRNPMAGKSASSGIARQLRSPTAGQSSFQNKFQSNLNTQARSTSRSSGSVRGSSGRSSGSGK